MLGPTLKSVFVPNRPVCCARYFTFLVDCKDPKACTILLRGASKDILNEVERNLQDAMNVARNVMVDARLVPGGGAVEMALAHVSHYLYDLFHTSQPEQRVLIVINFRC